MNLKYAQGWKQNQKVLQEYIDWGVVVCGTQEKLGTLKDYVYAFIVLGMLFAAVLFIPLMVAVLYAQI